jgi:hypothetical protein
MQRSIAPIAVALGMVLALSACTDSYDPGQRAVGGGRGAAAGALIGGAVGAVGGAATTPRPPSPAYYAPRRRLRATIRLRRRATKASAKTATGAKGQVPRRGTIGVLRLPEQPPHGGNCVRHTGAASRHNFTACSRNIEALDVTRDQDDNSAVSIRLNQARVGDTVVSALADGRPSAGQRHGALRNFEDLSGR